MEENTIEQLRMCLGCDKLCRHVCPTFFAWRSDSPTPHGRALLLYQDKMGVRDLDVRAIDVLYQCLECSHCLTWCLPEVDISQLVEDARIRLVREGRYPAKLDELQSSIIENHNPFNEPHEKRIKGVAIPQTKGVGVIYFTGCTAAYRERGIVDSTVDLLSSIGYSVSLSDDEWCCGSPLLRTGFEDSVIEQARHNVDTFNAINAEIIVVTCPGCYRVLTRDYPKHGLTLNKPVIHISELLAKHLESLPDSTIDSVVTYHDPCHLGRHCGVYEPPRDIIRRVVKNDLVEMTRNRDNAMCCGNGAGLRTLFPEYAELIGKERIRHAKNVKADYLVTACPFCKNMLSSQTDESIKVLDIPEFVLMSQKAREESELKTD